MPKRERAAEEPLIVERSYEPDKERIRRAVELLLAQPEPPEDGGEAA